MEEDTEYLKLPVDERCVHKLWKARLNGYEAATKLFSQIDDEKSPEWNKFAPLIKKFVVDSNAVAQEKGLEAALAFVENAKIASKNPTDVVAGVVAKCLGAPKAKTKELGIDILLMYVEIEKPDVVLEELVKGLDQKNPKAVSGCILALATIVKGFGPKVFNLKILLKQLSKILDNRDKAVRDEGKNLCIELYRWIGAALKPQLQDLKPIQVTELEGWFEKVSGDRPQRTRYLRSEQEKISKAQEAGDAPGGQAETVDVGDAGAEIDPYDLLDPVEILSKLPKDFFEKAEAKKWQERKEALEVLNDLVTKNPKLETGDYGDVVKLLKKVIGKDTNVMLVALGAQCLSGLAKGLKKKFHPYAASCLPVILEKFKEKKAIVVTALRDVIDSISVTLTFDAIQEDVCGALENKNPSIKAETASFLARVFARSPPSALANKKILKAYITPLMKTLNESDPQVRDSSAEALGTVLKVAGEKLVMPFMADVDPLKMAKVKEFADKVEVKGKPAGPAPSAAPVAAAAPAVKAGPRVVVPPKEDVPEPAPAAAAAPAKKPSTGAAAPGMRKPVPRKKASTTGPGGKAAGGAGKGGPGGDESLFNERELSMEEAEGLLEELLPADVAKGLVDGNWKTRLAAMEGFNRVVTTAADPAALPAQALIRLLCKKPGLKDNNFQVLKLRFDGVKAIAAGGKITRTSALLVLPDVTDKLGDAKSGTSASEALTAVAESRLTGGLSWVGPEVLKHALGQKNPKVQADAMIWLSQAVKEFGFNLPVKLVIDTLKGALGASNATVRQAAVTLIGTLSLYIGKTLRTFFDDEKPQILQLIDDELKKLEGTSAPAPIRGQAAGGAGGDDDDFGGGGGGPGGDAAPEMNVEDLIPRTDIADQITPTLIEKLADKNWKVRNEGLTEVKDIIGKAKFITPNLGELPTAMKARVCDLNKNLMVEALNICRQLAEAMGPKSKQHSRIFIPAIVGAMGDSKPHIRTCAKDCLSVWEEKIHLPGIFEAEMMAEALKLENPFLRAELLGWLKTKMPEDGPVRGVAKEDVLSCLPFLYACLEDRNPDVRKNAQDVFLNFMVQAGTEAMTRAAGKVKPASKNGIVALIDKCKPLMPARPVPPPAAPQAEAKAVRGGGGGAGRPKVVASTPVQQRLPDPSPDEDDDGGGGGGDFEEPAARGGAAAKAAPKAGAKPLVRQRAGMSKPAATKKKEEEVDLSPLLAVNNMKNIRFNDEAKLKVLKWNFATPREEFVDQLREQFIAAGTNQGLMAQMFSPDFKLHIKALDSLTENARNSAAVKANLDLLLKWLTLRFFETNPSVILKGLDYVLTIFDELTMDSYSMHDLEISCFVPYLLAKVGDPKEPVRNSAKRIIEKIPPMYNAQKLFPFLMDGLKSKNSRQRAECLEEMGWLITNYGLKVCGATPAAALKEMAKQISDRDNAVRNAALNAVVQAYFLTGEKIFKMVGPLAEKDMSMLEERVKRAQKSARPAPSGAAEMPPPGSPAVVDLNATRVTVRPGAASGAGGRGRPQSAFFPSHQSPAQQQQQQPGRDEKQFSPPALSASSTTSLAATAAAAQAAMAAHNSRKPSRVTEMLRVDYGAIEREYRPEGNRADRLYPKLDAVEKFDMSMSVEARTMEGLRTKSSQSVTATAYGASSSSTSISSSGSAVFSYAARPLTSAVGCAAVNSLIKEMASADPETARSALCGMLMVVKSRESHGDVKPVIQQIIVALNLLGKRFLSSEPPFSSSVDDHFRQEFAHNVVELAFVFSAFEDLISRVRELTYLELMKVMLEFMVDPRIVASKETLRYLNKFFSHAVKNSNPTICLGSALGLFREFYSNATDDPVERNLTLVNIVMRLLWKIIKEMPGLYTKYDCEPILQEMHQFFKFFPREHWLHKADKEKFPVKTVKTTLTNLCKNRLTACLKCLKAHPEFRDTDVGAAIEKAEREHNQRKSAGAEHGMDDAEGKLSRQSHEELTRIFAMIGDKDESEEGIRQLHAFRERHPGTNLDPFLVKSSEFFRQYIVTGLDKLDVENRRVRDEAAAVDRHVDALVVGSPFNLDVQADGAGDVDLEIYENRLKKIRARAGLPLSSSENAAMTPGSGGGGSPSSAGFNETPIDENRSFAAGIPRSGSFSPVENGSVGGSSHGSPGDENREFVSSAKEEAAPPPRQIPENIDSIMRRFNQIKRGELK